MNKKAQVLKESLRLAYDGKKESEVLKHIPELSCYNDNVFIGVKRPGRAFADLILVITDELTEENHYYLLDIRREYGFGPQLYIGYALAELDPKVNFSTVDQIMYDWTK